MSKVKSRGADGTTSAVVDVDVRRMLNAGKSIKIIKDGEEVSLRISEPTLEGIVLGLGDVLPLLAVLQDPAINLTENPIHAITIISSDPHTLASMKKCAAAISDKDPDFFDNLGLSAWMLIVLTAMDVVDVEGLKKLFIQLSQKMT